MDRYNKLESYVSFKTTISIRMQFNLCRQIGWNLDLIILEIYRIGRVVCLEKYLTDILYLVFLKNVTNVNFSKQQSEIRKSIVSERIPYRTFKDNLLGSIHQKWSGLFLFLYYFTSSLPHFCLSSCASYIAHKLQIMIICANPCN